MPSVIAKYLYTEDAENWVKNAWRIHKNWQNKGLGGTYDSSELYTDKINELYWDTSALNMSLMEILRGDVMTGHYDHPFIKFNKEIEDYPELHDEHDFLTMYAKQDVFERVKPFDIKKGVQHMIWSHDPKTDDDAVF